ncbi:MAG: protein kinase [Candidatus Latescibacterota bacterium]|nr:MAG: protein kinase [Candidatus Latescibacterota bacterium]
MDEKSIAGYKIRGVLGEGGMGVVYRAEDATLERTVALKVIRTQNLSDQAKKRFLREARASSRINHPNIVTVYAAGEEGGRPYLAMEFIEGRTLKDIIDEGPIPWEQAVRWAVDILDALGRLHEDGIIHRDLKPENIMVTGEGIVKLMDFGIARLATSETLTQEGTTVGTVYYMSPEQIAGKETKAQSDIFSMGVVLYQMLTASYPFEGEHPMAVMYSITNTKPRAIVELSRDVPEELQAVVARSLEKDPTDRYPDARGFAKALGDLLASRTSAVQGISRGKLMSRVVAPLVILTAVVVFVIFQYIGGRPRADRELATNHNELGWSYQEKGDYENAQIEFRKAIAADPTYAPPWNNLGALAVATGDLAEADSLFRKAIENEPDYTGAHHNLGSVRWDQGDLEGAERSFRRALDADSTFGAGYNDLGVLLLETDRLEEARDTLDKGLRYNTDPRYVPHLLKNRGRVALGLGKGDEAVGLWERAIELAPKQIEVHRLLAEWYETDGQIEKAKIHWTEVSKSNDESVRLEALEAMRRLGSP